MLDYDELSYYEYKNQRRSEKKRTRGRKTEKLTTEQILEALREEEVKQNIWKYLLNTQETDTNAFQDFHFHSYIPKPHPDDKDANEAQILILEAQRRFLQMLDPSIVDGQKVYHMDLSSAYLTSLANIKHSLKFNTKYPLPEVWDLNRDRANSPIHEYVLKDKFNIIKIRLDMPYDSRLNMFAPNTKIKYKGKAVDTQNQPRYGEIVQVRLELFVSNLYNIDSWDAFTTIFKDYYLDFKKVDVFTYDYVERRELFDMTDVRLLLETMKEESDPKERLYMKKAIVSFTGQLMNIDPGRRLIMLASNEEVMRRLYIILSKYTTVYGIQIDGIYFEPFDWPEYATPLDILYTIGNQVYGKFPSKYTKDIFGKLELWGPDKYKIAPFRLQEVHK